jgi:hypothetical protein
MEHQLYISHCTEYEFGWGSRPDGFLITESFEVMVKKISESIKMGSYECFWRYDEPKLIYCDDETYAKIKKQMGENDFAGYDNKGKEELNLFKKL